MSSAIFMSNNCLPAALAGFPAARGRMALAIGMVFETQLLDTDAVGILKLTLTNVVPGSIYDVEVFSTGTPSIPPGTVDGTSITLMIPVFPAGSVKNTLRVKIRKSTASPYYIPYETQVIAVDGSQSIYINQLSDE